MQILENDTIRLVLLSSAIGILFAISYVAVLIISNRRIIAEQQSKLDEINIREERYRSLFENSAAGMMKFDFSERRVYDANSAILSLFHVTSIPDLEKALLSIPDRYYTEIRSQIASNLFAPSQEIRMTGVDGKEQWLLFSARSSLGDQLSHVVIIDITEKKRLERVYLTSQRMESISLMTNSVAHDLQNIFSPIQLSLHLLQGKINTQRRKYILATAQKSANEGMKLVRTILSVGSSISLDRKRINLIPVVMHCIDMIGRRKRKKIKIISPKRGFPVIITGDKQRLVQVFTNLLSNAMDAMPDGGTIAVAIQLPQQSASAQKKDTLQQQSFVTVSIRDTGIGIPESEIERIFEPFYSTKLKSKGTGLGLAFVNNIIREHGGSITVSSIVGNGTTMDVHLPMEHD